jgi:hypothetical protein
MRRRRKRLAVAFAVLAGGYLLFTGGLFGGGGQPADLPEYPDPPAELTNESAKRVAFEHEAVYVERQLATSGRVTSYSVGSTVAGPEQRVVARNETGVYVRIRHPYGYSTRSADTDGLTNTTYLVNESAITVVARERGLYVV